MTRPKLLAKDIREFVQPGLYRHYDRDKVLLYVGETVNFLSRGVAAHLQSSFWRDLIHVIELEPMSKEEAKAIESKVIYRERPLFNRQIRHDFRWSEPMSLKEN